jgi:hypothetical protein
MLAMTIETYKSVEGIPFGATTREAMSRLGEPERTRKSRKGEDELWYHDCVLRFSPDGMQECSSLTSTPVTLNDKLITPEDAATVLTEEDQDLISFVGVLISSRYGVSFDTEHSVFTAFARGRMDRFKRKANR